MSRHYLLFLNGAVTAVLIERLRRLDPGEPMLHVVMPSLGDHDLTREKLKEASDLLRGAGFEIHAEFGTVASMRSQGWPFEGLVLAATPGSDAAWVELSTGDVVDGDFPLLAVA
ncbi:MAG TPA: hypothetical protein VMW08_12670 [Acidimicrobiales bacterium]|nr:hypothetical protein [Acidimicrobiales bacterium]